MQGTEATAQNSAATNLRPGRWRVPALGLFRVDTARRYAFAQPASGFAVCRNHRSIPL